MTQFSSTFFWSFNLESDKCTAFLHLKLDILFALFYKCVCSFCKNDLLLFFSKLSKVVFCEEYNFLACRPYKFEGRIFFMRYEWQTLKFLLIFSWPYVDSEFLPILKCKIRCFCLILFFVLKSIHF